MTSPTQTWARLVRARRAQLAAAIAAGGARRSHLARVRDLAAEDLDDVDRALLARVGAGVGPETVVVDVGAGAGRHAIPIAREGARVVAVDANPAMLALLARRAATAGVADRITTRPGRWETCAGTRGDVVLCARVLPTIVEVAGFVRRLHTAATDVVHVLVPPTLDPVTAGSDGGTPVVPRPSPDLLAAVVADVVGARCSSVALEDGEDVATLVTWSTGGPH